MIGHVNFSINLHSKIMDKFKLYIYDKYKDTQIDICNNIGALASETVIFIETDNKYNEFNKLV